jgi:hypothetical protein
MTLFIQRSSRRDTLAIHARLDELIRADENVRPRTRGVQPFNGATDDRIFARPVSHLPHFHAGLLMGRRATFLTP